MAKQIINIGTVANDNTGDSLRAGASKINSNFTQLFDSAVSATTATFKTPAGTWVGTPLNPLTSVITLSTTEAVNGGIAAVYYKGASEPTFSGGTVVLKSGTIVENELCLVWIIYDKTNNSFHVNIQSGATGSTPPGNTPTATAPVITVTNPVAGTPSATAPVITVTDPSVSATAPVITVT